MNTNAQPPTAKIYQFPRKISANAGREAKLAADRQQALPSVEFGSGWYHEAAVQADRIRKS